MNKELVASFRDGDNKKYKLYREFEEDDLWTVMNGRIRAFQGTADEVSAYCKDAGLTFELPRSEAAVEEPTIEAETIEEAVEEAIEEAVEEVPLLLKSSKESSEPLESGEPPKTSDGLETEVAETNITKTLDEKIAELEAKKAELEK